LHYSSDQIKPDLHNIWSGDGVLAAEWQHVSQADRQSGEGRSQADWGALPLSLASWGYPLCFSACSWGALHARAHRQGSPWRGSRGAWDEGCKEVRREDCGGKGHNGVGWGHGEAQETAAEK